MISSESLIQSINRYLGSVHVGGVGRYSSSVNGKETLYASCFAAMIMDYTGRLCDLASLEKKEWAEYILAHQDRSTGYFIGPEISQGKLLSDAHSKEHLSMHLTAHVLPALEILGTRPRHKLEFAVKYLDLGYLKKWLSGIDWSRAWLEGNNLFFVGQFLTYFYEEDDIAEAKKAIDCLFQWLDSQIDSNTGLWGTKGYSDIRSAIYGGYHQLLLYYYWNHGIGYPHKLIDSVLSIQHIDGGFSKYFGGGTCEDVDCVDILVNLYKRTNYRHREIETALRKAASNVIRRLNDEGGFYYKRNMPFYHMGMEYTYAAPQKANMFSTWFSLHTLLLISEIIALPYTRDIQYNFNRACSMGWHEKSDLNKISLYGSDTFNVLASELLSKWYYYAVNIRDNNRIINKMYNVLRGRHG